MERSLEERVRLNFRKARIKKRMEDMEKHIFIGTMPLGPIQCLTTGPSIHKSSMIPPGGWFSLQDNRLPAPEEESLVWLRHRFSAHRPPADCVPALYLWFANDWPTGYLETVEGTLWLDGNPYQGLDFNHREVLSPGLSMDQDHEITILLDFKPEHKERKIINFDFRFLHKPSFGLFHRLECLIDAFGVLDEDSPEAHEILELIDMAIAGIPFDNPGSTAYYQGVKASWEAFGIPEGWSEGIRAKALVTGHSHIDTAWLWPVETTRRKTLRTFTTACRLMEEYENYNFFQSQPQLYEFVREREPDLFDKIISYAAKGKWIAGGASWVEPDCNIPGGESLIRQFLYGKNFFKEHFNIHCAMLWLPDTFGFNGNLPQLMRGAGIKYLITSKLSWNRYTRFPHDSFVWKGIDGSAVLVHFLTANNWESQSSTTYNGVLKPSELWGAWKTFAQKDVCNEILVSYGYGDGGGGPARDMLERLDIMGSLPGIPSAAPGNPEEFMGDLERIKDRLPLWKGELYLEYHRGTYTSRAKIKKLHRKAEIMLSMLENAVCLDMIARRASLSPDIRKKLDDLWKTLLLNQFHDIIAGSSIHRVNIEAEGDLQSIVDQANPMIEDILRPYAEAWGEMLNYRGKKVCFNGGFGDRILAGADEGGKIKKWQCKEFDFAPKDGVPSDGVEIGPVRVSGMNVENDFYWARIDHRGEILSFVDKGYAGGSEFIIPGRPANRLVFYEDRPHNWDAWEIDQYYREKPREEPEAQESGWFSRDPVESVFRTRLKFRNSLIIQDLVFYAHKPRIDFRTKIEWNEKNLLLKAEFPLLINCDKIISEIPFGFIGRPSNPNRAADQGQFEIPALRWSAVFEGNRGAALLNDSKYGYSAGEGSLEITLLKSAVSPDPDGEQGIHRFTYSFLPLCSGGPDGVLIRESEDLNCGMREFELEKNSTLPRQLPVFHLHSAGNHVFAGALKPSEDGIGVVIRLYEGLNMRGIAELEIPNCITEAYSIDFMEDRMEKTEIIRDENRSFIRLPFNPFEIRSFYFSYERPELLP